MKLNLSTRVVFGLIFLPAVLLSIAVALAFTTSCMKQFMYSSQVKVLYVPLAVANIDNWGISVFLLIALLGIIWPKGGPHPVLAFGMSVGIIFPATFSIFVAAEIHFSSGRYRTMLKNNEISIDTMYQRMLTEDMLNALKNTFQQKLECCGLKDFNYYCPNNKTIMVTPDDQHKVNMKESLNITKSEYLSGRYASEELNEYNITFLNAKYKLENEAFPDSCCASKKCKSRCRTKGSPKDVYQKGCADKIIEPLDPCLKVVPISYIFPWIALIYASIFSWAHLRKHQGVDITNFGKVKKEPSMPMADPEEFEKKDLSEVTKFAESLAGESKNLSPKENVSKATSRLLTPPGRRNSKLSAKVPSSAKLK